MRYFDEDFSLKEELLFVETLTCDTKGKSVFNLVKTFFIKNDIPSMNIIACATDGAPSITDHYRDFITYLKREVPEIFIIHCVIHRHHFNIMGVYEQRNSTKTRMG